MTKAKLTDIQIKAWIKAGERFDARADGNGLYLCFPENITPHSGAIVTGWPGNNVLCTSAHIPTCH